MVRSARAMAAVLALSGLVWTLPVHATAAAPAIEPATAPAAHCAAQPAAQAPPVSESPVSSNLCLLHCTTAAQALPALSDSEQSPPPAMLGPPPADDPRASDGGLRSALRSTRAPPGFSPLRTTDVLRL